MDKRRNFSEREKCSLISLVNKYAHILENKRTDGTSINKKAEVWNSISTEFNSINTDSGPRTSVQLKSLYKNLKRQTKKEVAEANISLYDYTNTKKRYLEEEDNTSTEVMQILKKQKVGDKKGISKTGGGVYTPHLNEGGARLLAVIADQVQPLQNPYDDGSRYHNDDTTYLINEDSPISLHEIPDPATPNHELNATPESPPPEIRHSSIPRKLPAKPKNKKLTSEQLRRIFYSTKIRCARMQLMQTKLQIKTIQEQHAIDMEIKKQTLKNLQA